MVDSTPHEVDAFDENMEVAAGLHALADFIAANAITLPDMTRTFSEVLTYQPSAADMRAFGGAPGFVEEYVDDDGKWRNLRRKFGRVGVRMFIDRRECGKVLRPGNSSAMAHVAVTIDETLLRRIIEETVLGAQAAPPEGQA